MSSDLPLTRDVNRRQRQKLQDDGIRKKFETQSSVRIQDEDRLDFEDEGVDDDG